MQRSDILIFLGNRVRHLRKRAKLSILGLATMCDISEKHLGQIERGKGNASVELLEKLASNFGIGLHELLDVEAERGREQLTAELHGIIAKISDEDLKRIYKVVKACME